MCGNVCNDTAYFQRSHFFKLQYHAHGVFIPKILSGHGFRDYNRVNFIQGGSRVTLNEPMAEYFEKCGIRKEEPALIEFHFPILNKAAGGLKIINTTNILDKAGKIIFQGKCQGKRQACRILTYTFEIIDLGNSVNVIGTLVVTVIAQFIHHI